MVFGCCLSLKLRCWVLWMMDCIVTSSETSDAIGQDVVPRQAVSSDFTLPLPKCWLFCENMRLAVQCIRSEQSRGSSGALPEPSRGRPTGRFSAVRRGAESRAIRR
jgi:hypothetical protein